MTDAAGADADWQLIMGRMQIEFRILTDLLNRLECTVADHLLARPNAQISADMQVLDLIIQTTQALESISATLQSQSESGDRPDLVAATAQLGLKDMAYRLAHGLQGHAPQATADRPGRLDLF